MLPWAKDKCAYIIAAGLHLPTLETNRHHRPTRERTRHFLHIGLGIATVHPQRVQFHQFTGIVLVGLAFAITLVVQIDQHGWAMGAGSEQVSKFAKRIWANHIAIIAGLQILAGVLLKENIEVI